VPKFGSQAPRAREGRWTFNLRSTADAWMIEGMAIR